MDPFTSLRSLTSDIVHPAKEGTLESRGIHHLLSTISVKQHVFGLNGIYNQMKYLIHFIENANLKLRSLYSNLASTILVVSKRVQRMSSTVGR